jgi:hypothetical protein
MIAKSLRTARQTLIITSFRFRKEAKFIYKYDVGDCWRHEVRIEDQLEPNGEQPYPTPQVLKLDYTKALNSGPGGAQSDSVLGGLGFLF